jgi:tetratricopeptide (TPR) repeat protein
MPSLQALEEFKASFRSIGGEQQALAAQNLSMDDFPLPNHEPSPATAGSGDPGADDGGLFQASAGEDDFIDFGDLGDLLGGGGLDGDTGIGAGEAPLPEFPEIPEEGSPDPNGDMDFGAFLDTIPDDLGIPSGENGAEAAESLSGTDEAEPSEFPDFDLPNEIPAQQAVVEEDGDFGLPPELLDGLADEIETGRASEKETAIPEDLVFPEVLPGTEGVQEAAAFPEDIAGLENAAGLDLGGGEVPAADFDMGDFPDFSDSEQSPAESIDAFSEDGIFPEGEAAGVPVPGEFSMPEDGGEEALESLEEILPAEDDEDMGFPAAETDGGFDLGGETLDLDTGETPGADSSDSFDNFKLDSNDMAADFNIGGESGADGGFGDDFANLEDFSLSGIDDTFGGRTPGSRPPGQDDQQELTEAGDALGEVEEIELSEEDMSRIGETLASYPLNLRVACEELIAEEVVAPDQLSKLLKLLIKGASPKDAAALAGKILGRTITIPKGFEKKTGEELEAEQSSFAYIFVHNFLPVFRLFMMIAMVVMSVGYLVWQFIYTPLKAEEIYKLGHERIAAGEYSRANERFREAFAIHQKKDWFYTYARSFRDMRAYELADEKYRELLNFTAAQNKRAVPEKTAVLEYAGFATNYRRDYELAGRVLRQYILNYNVWDKEALLALGDNDMAWGEIEPSRLEDAREAYAKLLERYGQSDPVLERMLKYFIRTDNLRETLSLKAYFMASERRKITAPTLAELGGYLLDKRFEEVRGVPNEYLYLIEGIRDVLLRAIRTDPALPEPFYHLSRYYYNFNNPNDERLSLEQAIRVFDMVKEETPRRLSYRINALRRHARILIENRELLPAQEDLIEGVNLYKDGVSRRLLSPSPEFGKLYADLGDLEYFIKEGDMETALGYYQDSELNGWAPPEMQYRMGAAHYRLGQWNPALDRLTAAYSAMPRNRRILYALGNASYMRGSYFAAQGYYDRLLDILNAQKAVFSQITPTNNRQQLDLAERLMTAQNNMGVTLEALAERTGNTAFRSQALGLYTESARAWDIWTRNPETMMRMLPAPGIYAPGVNPAYLNIQNTLHPAAEYERWFFLYIDKDVTEPSFWEELFPLDYTLAQGTSRGR